MRVLNGEKLRVTTWPEGGYLVYRGEGKFSYNDGTDIALTRWLRDKYIWEVLKPKPRFSVGQMVVFDGTNAYGKIKSVESQDDKYFYIVERTEDRLGSPK